MKRLIVVLLLVVGVVGVVAYTPQTLESPRQQENETNEGGLLDTILPAHPLTIESLRKGNYPGSELTFEETLSPGSNYSRYIVSYQSEGNKIFALLTIPNGDMPEDGWPGIVFNHGYIPPREYTTTGKYIAYTDAFSRNGYVVIKSDYRGHGESEGEAAGGYGSNAYTIDVLNALASLKHAQDPLSPAGRSGRFVDPNRIGMWGHSMGGHITLRSMVVTRDIKAGNIWAGVVASYPDMLNNWRRRNPNASPFPGNTSRGWRQALVAQYGEPEANPDFWNSISATSYLSDISGPLELHHGSADSSVPLPFSQTLEKLMNEAGKEVELFTYPGDDHNISQNLSTALSRSVAFFDKYLK